MNSHDLDFMIQSINDLPEHDIILTIPEHCKNRMMPKPLAGYYDPQATPYLVDIMRDLSPQSPVERVAFIKSAQIGATTAAENAILFYLDHAPGSVILYITASDDMAAEWSRTRLDYALRSIGLLDKMAPIVDTGTSRKTGDRVLSKSFLNGSRIRATSYNRAATLRMDSIQILLMDEIDAAPVSVSGEGDPQKIAEARTMAYSGRKKIFLFSTPTEELTSKITPAYFEGDQRLYYVPCPHCQTMQPLLWRDESGEYRMKFELDENKHVIPESVRYTCKNPDCTEPWTDKYKNEILQKGVWTPQNPNAKPNFHSYRINSMYSPFLPWVEIVEKFLSAKDSPAELQSFVNIYLGEPWKEQGALAPRVEKLIELRHNYKSGTVPDGVLVATLGIDVQQGQKDKDGLPARLEMELVGHSPGGRAYSIGYYVLPGAIDNPYAGAWLDLKNIIAGGRLPIQPGLICIDSSFKPEVVYEFCQGSTCIHPVQGADRLDGKMLFKEYLLKNYGGLARYDLAGTMYKDLLYQRLSVRPSADGGQPEGLQIFPRDYPDSYFEQLTAEHKVAVKRGSAVVGYRYVKNKERNEALDCRVYAMAGLDILMWQFSKTAGLKSVDQSLFWGWCVDGQ